MQRTLIRVFLFELRWFASFSCHTTLIFTLNKNSSEIFMAIKSPFCCFPGMSNSFVLKHLYDVFLNANTQAIAIIYWLGVKKFLGLRFQKVLFWLNDTSREKFSEFSFLKKWFPCFCITYIEVYQHRIIICLAVSPYVFAWYDSMNFAHWTDWVIDATQLHIAERGWHTKSIVVWRWIFEKITFSSNRAPELNTVIVRRIW